MSLNSPLTKELCAQIQKPATTLDLLKNLKQIMDNDLILRDDLYVEKCLVSMTGGKVTVNQQARSTHFHFEELSHLCPLPYYLHNGQPAASVGMFARRSFEDHMLVWSAWDFYCNVSDPTLVYENIVGILGEPDEIPYESATQMPPDGIRTPTPPPTHRFGDCKAIYLSRDAVHTRFINLSLSGEGTLRTAHFSVSTNDHAENKLRLDFDDFQKRAEHRKWKKATYDREAWQAAYLKWRAGPKT